MTNFTDPDFHNAQILDFVVSMNDVFGGFVSLLHTQHSKGIFEGIVDYWKIGLYVNDSIERRINFDYQ